MMQERPRVRVPSWPIRTLFVVATTIATPALHAQSGTALEGRRIRLSVPGHVLDGRAVLLDEIREDTFLVHPPGGEPVAIERDRIEGMEVWQGRRSHALTGLTIGAGIGVLTGLIAAAESDDDDALISSGDFAGPIAFTFGAAGAVAGLIVGALVKTDRWGEVPPAAPLSIQPTFAGSRPGIRLRIPVGSP